MLRVEQEILREARRLILRHEISGRLLAEERVRRGRRSTAPGPLARVSRPERWAIDSGFDPYLTRSRATRVGHSISGALAKHTYQPRRPYAHHVPKPDGGQRLVSIYQVADSAVSKMLFEGILRKNLPLLSSRTYAYRKDISSQDAIQYVKSEITRRDRLYVAEYDFRKYFDHINHEHILRVLKDRFFVTEEERSAIEGFLRVSPSAAEDYEAIGGPERMAGIPQGTSISLFLANVAAWELDRELESRGVGFARYADDTLIWSKDYARICEAVDVLHAQADVIGVSVNAEKSPGIRLLVPKGAQGEIKTTEFVDYLGYRIACDGVHMKPAAEARIKHRIGQLIFNTLLREPLSQTQQTSRLASNVDQDYVMVIARLRRYLYGDLSERALRRYQLRGAPLRRFKGVMSAYPLLDDSDHLAALDDWILDHLWLSLRKRRLLLEGKVLDDFPPPHGLSRGSLRALSVKSKKTGMTIDLRVPSVRKVAALLAEAADLHGPAAVGKASAY